MRPLRISLAAARRLEPEAFRGSMTYDELLRLTARCGHPLDRQTLSHVSNHLRRTDGGGGGLEEPLKRFCADLVTLVPQRAQPKAGRTHRSRSPPPASERWHDGGAPDADSPEEPRCERS